MPIKRHFHSRDWTRSQSAKLWNRPDARLKIAAELTCACPDAQRLPRLALCAKPCSSSRGLASRGMSWFRVLARMHHAKDDFRMQRPQAGPDKPLVQPCRVVWGRSCGSRRLLCLLGKGCRMWMTGGHEFPAVKIVISLHQDVRVWQHADYSCTLGLQPWRYK